MKVFFRILFSFLFVFSGIKAYALELSIDDAVKFALANNEDIQIAGLMVSQMEMMMREIESIKYPTLSGSLQYLANDYRTYPQHGSDIEQSGFAFGVNVEGRQMLYTFGLIKKSIEAATLSKEVAIRQKGLSINQLAYSVRSAYYAALVADNNYKIAEESYKNALNSKRLLERSASVRSSQSDLIKVSADIASRKPELESTMQMRKQAYRLLQILCVLPEPVTVLTSKFDSKSLPVLNEEELISRVSLSSDVKLLEAQIMLNLKTAEVKKGALKPSINLIGGYKMTDQSPHVILTDPNWTGEGYIGLSASIPFYDGGKALAQSRQEKISGYMNMGRLTQTRRVLSNDIKNAVENFYTYIKILSMDDEAVSLAEKSYQMSLSRFANGQTSAVELNDVERSLSTLKNKRIATVNTIYDSLNTIERIIGSLK